MLKPLSQKTLEKKYAELGLSKANIELLHKYFLCFANLYGVISVRDAWEIFKSYEGCVTVHKKDFTAFSGIVQREAGHPYSVYELKEVYSGEETTNPLDRLIINNKLVMFGYYKFLSVYATVDRQSNKPYFTPDKQTFLTFVQDRFYLTEAGKRMKAFVENLQTNGISRDFYGNKKYGLVDIYGNPIKGKRLSDFVFFTDSEQFEIDYTKNESRKEKYKIKFSITASEKILERIQEYIMTGGILKNESVAEEIRFLMDHLDRDFGVALSEKQFEKFAELFMSLNNNSNLWLNCGWSPDELFRRTQHTMPLSFSVGPNMKKMFASGEMNRDEFEKSLAEFGITLDDD